MNNRRPQNQQQQGGQPDMMLMSDSLRKAADAAAFLDKSEHAKDAYKLASEKEKTRQLELQESKSKLDIQKSQIAEEERRKTVQYETEMSKKRAEYQVQLELQRD